MVTETPSIESVLQLAASKEAEAHEFYLHAAEQAQAPGAKAILKELAQEELKHKEYLEHLDMKAIGKPPSRDVQSLGISEFLVAKPLQPDATFQDILIYAMKREERAERFFHDLAETMPAGDMKQLFKTLEREETRHKARLEKVYDDVIYKEN